MKSMFVPSQYRNRSLKVIESGVYSKSIGEVIRQFTFKIGKRSEDKTGSDPYGIRFKEKWAPNSASLLAFLIFVVFNLFHET